MMIHGTIRSNTLLVIKREDMIRLDEDLSANCERVFYIGTTIYGVDIVFSSLDELMQFEELKDYRLRALRIAGFNEKTRVLHITLGWLNEMQSGSRYPNVLICQYSVSSTEGEKALKMSIDGFIKEAKADRSMLGKYLPAIILCLFFMISAAVVYVLFSKWDIGHMKLWEFCGLMLLLYAALFFLVNAAMWAATHLTQYLFPPITFAWGIGETDYMRRKDLRGQIFWCVLVCSLISLVTGIALKWLLG